MELLLRIAGTVVGLLGGFLTGLWEIFLSPPHTFWIILPVSPVLAILTNIALVWFTKQVTGHTGLALLPGIVWFVTMFIGATRTTEGDVLIPGNDWPGLLAILLGTVAWGLAAYRMMLFRTEAATRRAVAPAAADPAKVAAKVPAKVPIKAAKVPTKQATRPRPGSPAKRR